MARQRGIAEVAGVLFAGLWAIIEHQLLSTSSADSNGSRWLVQDVARRFYEACKYDVIKSFQRIRDTWQWRSDANVDGAFDPLSTVWSEAKKEGADGKLWVLPDTDAEGRAYVVWKPFAEYSEKFESLLIYTIELATKLASNNGIVLIVDCVSIGSGHCMKRSLAIRLLRILLRHYPNLLDRALVVDSSPMQYLRYKTYWMHLPKAVRRKIQFCRRNGFLVDWSRYNVDENVIPEELGGYSQYEFDWNKYIAEYVLISEMPLETSFTSVSNAI